MATTQEERINDAVRLNDIITQMQYGYDSRVHARRDAADFARLGGETRFNQLMQDPQINQYLSAGSGNPLISTAKTIAPYLALGAGMYGLAGAMGTGGILGASGAGGSAAGGGGLMATPGSAANTIASMGGAGGGVTAAQEAAGMLSAAGAPGVAASTAASNVATGLGYGSLGTAATGAGLNSLAGAGDIMTTMPINPNQIGTKGGAMTDAEIAAALESGQYGGMTGALTPAEIAAAGGASTGLGSSTSGLSSMIPGGANTIGSLISAGTALYGANQAAGSAADAAAIQKQASDAALAEQRRQFDLGQAAQMPWRTAGETALGEQTNLMGLGPQGAEGQLASLMKSPGYEFRLGEGQKALERSAAARGGLFGGATGKALTQYGQDYATGEYGNRLSQLSSMSGQGQAAASRMAGQGTQYAGNVSNLLTGMGNAGAASSIAQGAAKQSGILGAGQALSNLFNPPKQQLSLADLLRGG